MVWQETHDFEVVSEVDVLDVLSQVGATRVSLTKFGAWHCRKSCWSKPTTRRVVRRITLNGRQ